MGLGWKVGGGGGPLPVGGDLAGTTSSAIVDGISGAPVIQALNTIYVDPNGDASSPGTNPATPTTLANAIATAGASTNVIIGEGVYTTGGAITIPADDVTLTARQGGTQSPSVTIQDQIVLGAGRTRFNAFGIQFDGGFDDDSDGRHYFAACSAGGGTYDRANPKNFVVWQDCDFAALTYTASGVGTGSSLIVEGAAASLGPFTQGASGARVEIHEATTERLVISQGTLELRDARVVDATLGINASAGTTVSAYNTRFTTSVGVPVPVTLDAYLFSDVVYEPSGSTLGSEIGTPVAFSSDIRYAPDEPTNYDPAVTKTHEALQQLSDRMAFVEVAQTQTPASTTSSTLQDYLVLTTSSVTTGLYFIDIGLGISGSSSGTELRAELIIDAIPFSGPLLQTQIAGGRYIFSSLIPLPWLAGVHTVRIQFAQAGGPGTTTALFASIAVRRAK